MTDEEKAHLQHLAGIVNSRSQLVKAAGELALLQLTEAMKRLDDARPADPFLATENDYKLAQLIAINLASIDLVTTKK